MTPFSSFGYQTYRYYYLPDVASFCLIFPTTLKFFHSTSFKSQLPAISLTGTMWYNSIGHSLLSWNWQCRHLIYYEWKAQSAMGPDRGVSCLAWDVQKVCLVKTKTREVSARVFMFWQTAFCFCIRGLWTKTVWESWKFTLQKTFC